MEAYIWANLAAAQGGGELIKFKDWLRKKMAAEQVAEAQKLSAELFKRIESSKSD